MGQSNAVPAWIRKALEEDSNERQYRDRITAEAAAREAHELMADLVHIGIPEDAIDETVGAGMVEANGYTFRYRYHDPRLTRTCVVCGQWIDASASIRDMADLGKALRAYDTFTDSLHVHAGDLATKPSYDDTNIGEQLVALINQLVEAKLG